MLTRPKSILIVFFTVFYIINLNAQEISQSLLYKFEPMPNWQLNQSLYNPSDITSNQEKFKISLPFSIHPDFSSLNIINNINFSLHPYFDFKVKERWGIGAMFNYEKLNLSSKATSGGSVYSSYSIPFSNDFKLNIGINIGFYQMRDDVVSIYEISVLNYMSSQVINNFYSNAFDVANRNGIGLKLNYKNFSIGISSPDFIILFFNRNSLYFKYMDLTTLPNYYNYFNYYRYDSQIRNYILNFQQKVNFENTNWMEINSILSLNTSPEFSVNSFNEINVNTTIRNFRYQIGANYNLKSKLHLGLSYRLDYNNYFFTELEHHIIPNIGYTSKNWALIYTMDLNLSKISLDYMNFNVIYKLH